MYAYSNPTVYIDLYGYESVTTDGDKAIWNVQKDLPGPINWTTDRFKIGKAPYEYHLLSAIDQPYVYLTEEFGGGKVKTEDLKKAADKFLFDVGDISQLDPEEQKIVVREYIDLMLNPRGEDRNTDGMSWAVAKDILWQNFKEATLGLPKNAYLELKATNRYYTEDHPETLIMLLIIGQLGAASIEAEAAAVVAAEEALIAEEALALEVRLLQKTPIPPKGVSTSLSARGVRPASGTRIRPDGIPENWRIRSTRGEGGTEYYNPQNPNESVRIMQGNPNSPFPNSQKPYARQRNAGGVYYKADGTLSTGRRGGLYDPDAHIPLEQFQLR